jgi:peptidoglycan/LPS O-acetylase OafA/YrhL
LFLLICAASVALFLRQSTFWQDAALTNVGTVESNAMVLAFLAGVTIYLYRDKIKLNRFLFVACFATALALHYNRYQAYLAVFPIAYMTVYLGMCMPKKLPFIFGGDYSYGMYLYAFPIQQTLTHLMPNYRIWWLNILLAVPLTFLFSYLSWHLIEKHAFRLKVLAQPTGSLPRLELKTKARLMSKWERWGWDARKRA